MMGSPNGHCTYWRGQLKHVPSDHQVSNLSRTIECYSLHSLPKKRSSRQFCRDEDRALKCSSGEADWTTKSMRCNLKQCHRGLCWEHFFLEQISPNNGSLLILHHQYQTKYAIQETSAMAFPFWEVGLSICDSEPMGSLSSPSLPGAWPWASPAGPAVRQIEMFPLEPLLWGGLELRVQVRRDNGIKNKRQLCRSKNCNSKSTGN